MIWNKFKLDTAKNLPLYRLLADRLRQMIVVGSLAPGEKLPSSRELQKLLCVSAITIESGLNALVEEGFLCRRPRCGTFVAETLPGAGVKIDPPKCIYAIFSNMSVVSGYWFLVLGELERQFRAAGYQVCFRQQEAGAPVPVEISLYRDCAGIVLCGYNSLAYTCEIQKRNMPVVLIGSLDTESDSEENLDMVVHNDRERAMISTAHLLDLGHRRIACVTGPARCENADRNCELVGQLLCEEEGHGAPVVDRGRRRSLPGGVDIPGRGQQRIARHGQHADRVEFTGVGPPSQLRAAVGERGNLEFHVRLPGGEPDFSERDVLRRRRFAAFELGDLKRQADGGRHRREAEQEFPVRAGTGFGAPVPERGADPAERCAPAPDRNGPVSLQNGVVPEQCGEFQHGFFSCIDSIF